MYGEDAAPDNRATLHTYVSNLRRTLGDVVVRQGDGYLLRSADVDDRRGRVRGRLPGRRRARRARRGRRRAARRAVDVARSSLRRRGGPRLPRRRDHATERAPAGRARGTHRCRHASRASSGGRRRAGRADGRASLPGEPAGDAHAGAVPVRPSERGVAGLRAHPHGAGRRAGHRSVAGAAGRWSGGSSPRIERCCSRSAPAVQRRAVVVADVDGPWPDPDGPRHGARSSRLGAGRRRRAGGAGSR